MWRLLPRALQVTCVGQIVCAVVADTKPHAKQGAAAVKITYEDLPDRVFTVEVTHTHTHTHTPATHTTCPLLTLTHSSAQTQTAQRLIKYTFERMQVCLDQTFHSQVYTLTSILNCHGITNQVIWMPHIACQDIIVH